MGHRHTCTKRWSKPPCLSTFSAETLADRTSALRRRAMRQRRQASKLSIRRLSTGQTAAKCMLPGLLPAQRWPGHVSGAGWSLVEAQHPEASAETIHVFSESTCPDFSLWM